MSRSHPWYRRAAARRRALACVVAAAWPVLAPAQATIQALDDEVLVEPAWPRDLAETFRLFFERVDVEALTDGLAQPTAMAPPSLPGVLAALPSGTEGPFRYVQRNIRYEAYGGSVRGAAGTLAAGAGNSVDQAMLLAELYRARGLRVRFVRGSLRWRDAVALVGPRTEGLPDRGDPWLRRVEQAAEHWWVEIQQGGRWRSFDPSFVGSGAGDEIARRRDVLEEVPLSARALATVRVTRDDEELLRVSAPLAELIGTSLAVASAPVEPDAEETPLPAEVETPAPAIPVAEPTAAELIADFLPRRPDGARPLTVRLGDRVHTTGPLSAAERAATVLEIEVQLPMGSAQRLQVPLGPAPDSVVRVAFGSAAVGSGQIAAHAAAVDASFRALAQAEVAAFEAWRARPQEAPLTALPMAPLPPPVWPVVAADGESLHPTLDLYREAVRAWTTFQTQGIEMLSWILLAAPERLPLPAGSVRQPLRIAAVRWDPLGESTAGALTVWASDSVEVVGADVRERAGVRAAYGMLHSGVLGQVLNRIADRPPATAFDRTLRAVGSGGRLDWWTEASPPSLPADAMPVAADDLRAGRWLAGSGGQRDGGRGAAWWAMVPRSGLTEGRVVTRRGVAQAAVAFGDGVDLAVTESLLASLPDLHAALRWLIGVAGADSLADLVPGVCAAAPLVRELMRAGAPATVVPPAFERFCRPQP